MKDEAGKTMGFQSQQARWESSAVGGGGVRRGQASGHRSGPCQSYKVTSQSLHFLALSTLPFPDPFLCYKISEIFLNALL